VLSKSVFSGGFPLVFLKGRIPEVLDRFLSFMLDSFSDVVPLLARVSWVVGANITEKVVILPLCVAWDVVVGPFTRNVAILFKIFLLLTPLVD
jgi:hypothetical protein